MQTRKIADGVYQIPLGLVNAYAIETRNSLILVDTGFPGSAAKIFQALKEIGHSPTKLAHVILTHAHPDHVGSAAEIVRASGAETWMHVLDVPAAESAAQPAVHPMPGILPKLLFSTMKLMPSKFEGVHIDHAVSDGDELPGHLVGLHVPGHCRGQIALLSPRRRLLFAADSCMNLRGLRQPMVNEDEVVGRHSLNRISQLDFDIACFGHGRTIVSGAGAKFRVAFGNG